MKSWVLIAGLLVALITVSATAAAAEEQPSSKPPKASSPIISLKANMGGQNMEVEVEQTDNGMEVRGTFNEQTVSATSTRQPDGTVHVEVTKDEGTMVEMTINPEALRQQTSPPPQKKP
jgi:hypothetical protein